MNKSPMDTAQHQSVDSIKRSRSLALLFALTLAPLTGEAVSVVSYNLTDYASPLTKRVSMPPKWLPASVTIPYQGSLDTMWYVGLSSDQDTAQVSASEAIKAGVPSDFVLMTGPDNCWSMMMNFGLVTLGKASDLVITLKADPTQSSYLAPAFALYQGWDTSKTASRHSIITFESNNPIGTSGLTFMGDSFSNNSSNTTTKTFHNLPAGNYEVFVTNRSNASNSGTYAATFQTYPTGTAPDTPITQSDLCGPTSATIATAVPADAGLCVYGHPQLTPTRQPDGRFLWTCGQGEGKKALEICYSLSPKNKHKNQAPLILQPGTIKVSPGKSVLQEASGGSGGGTLSFSVINPSKAMTCKILKKGTTATITAGTNQSGSCTIRATKAASGNFNSVRSLDYVITFGP